MKPIINRRDIFNKKFFTCPLKNILIQITVVTKFGFPCTTTYNIIWISLVFSGKRGFKETLFTFSHYTYYISSNIYRDMSVVIGGSTSSTPKPHKKILADLKASILNPALTSHFQCWFFPPPRVRVLLTGDERDDRFTSLSCSEAALPATSLATHQMTGDHTGVTERHAYRRQYNPTSSFTFYVDLTE
jgi:hypothetical protein